jgi:hypothetical protein
MTNERTAAAGVVIPFDHVPSIGAPCAVLAGPRGGLPNVGPLADGDVVGPLQVVGHVLSSPTPGGS